MTEKTRLIVGVGALVAAYYLATAPTAPPVAPVAPVPVTPNPCPDGKCPLPKSPPKRPWGPREVPVGANVGGNVASDGTELACDLPEGLHLKNVGGSDGAGLCVFTSISHSARWQNVPLLSDFRDWMRSYPGGGYPEKVDKMVAKIATEKGASKPDYVQVEGLDLDVLKAASRNGLMPAVTYNHSPTGRYGGGRIAHMVSLVHADDRHFVVLDNNFPGADKYEWMTPEEFKRTYAPGWCVILLNPGPPPVPKNKR